MNSLVRRQTLGDLLRRSAARSPHKLAIACGDTRWSYWEAGASLRGTLVPGQLRSYGEAWMALRGRISVAAVFDGERGAEGGVIARVARDNLWARFGYRIEQTRFTSGRRETVEAIRFSVGWDLR